MTGNKAFERRVPHYHHREPQKPYASRKKAKEASDKCESSDLLLRRARLFSSGLSSLVATQTRLLCSCSSTYSTNLAKPASLPDLLTMRQCRPTHIIFASRRGHNQSVIIMSFPRLLPFVVHFFIVSFSISPSNLIHISRPVIRQKNRTRLL